MTYGNVFKYQLKVSLNISWMLVVRYQFSHALHLWMCLWILYILGVENILRKDVGDQRALTAQWVEQAAQPVDQVNPSSRRDTTGCDWAGVARTVALTLMRHARVPGHTLLEMVRRQVGTPCRVRWHCGHTQQALMRALHGHVRWAVSSHHALGKRARRGQQHIHA